MTHRRPAHGGSTPHGGLAPTTTQPGAPDRSTARPTTAVRPGQMQAPEEADRVPTENQSDADAGEETSRVYRTEQGVRIETKMTRGTGTRDQETHRVRTDEEDLATAIATHESAMEYVRERLAPATRAIQPEAPDEEPEADR